GRAMTCKSSQCKLRAFLLSPSLLGTDKGGKHPAKDALLRAFRGCPSRDTHCANASKSTNIPKRFLWSIPRGSVLRMPDGACFDAHYPLHAGLACYMLHVIFFLFIIEIYQ